MPTHVASFLTVVAVISVTPGPDTALVLRNALQGGRRDGVLTAIGCSAGLLVWGAASALGLAALFRASAAAFDAIRIAGGMYLIWLGLWMILARPNRADASCSTDAAPVNRRDHQPLLEGLLTDLLNPKAAAFFTALLPQFLAPGDPLLSTTLLFAGIASLAAFVGLSAYASLAAGARQVFGRPSVRRGLDRITGVVLLAVGLRMLAHQSR